MGCPVFLEVDLIHHFVVPLPQHASLGKADKDEICGFAVHLVQK